MSAKKLIQKLGWIEGDGLGKDKQGATSHVKVSLKNDRDGIGLKSEKYNHSAGLLQTSTYDMLLKIRYEEMNGNKAKEAGEKSMSRPRFGRAVRPDYSKPLNDDDWNKILGKSTATSDKIEEIKKENNIIVLQSDTKFVTKTLTVNEYFEQKMKLRMASLTKVEAKETDESTESKKRAHSIDEYLHESPEKKKVKKEKTDGVLLEPSIKAECETADDQIYERKRAKKEKRKSKKAEDLINSSCDTGKMKEESIVAEASQKVDEKPKKRKEQNIVELEELPNGEKVRWSPMDTSNVKDILGYRHY